MGLDEVFTPISKEHEAELLAEKRYCIDKIMADHVSEPGARAHISWRLIEAALRLDVTNSTRIMDLNLPKSNIYTVELNGALQVKIKNGYKEVQKFVQLGTYTPDETQDRGIPFFAMRARSHRRNLVSQVDRAMKVVSELYGTAEVHGIVVGSFGNRAKHAQYKREERFAAFAEKEGLPDEYMKVIVDDDEKLLLSNTDVVTRDTRKAMMKYGDRLVIYNPVQILPDISDILNDELERLWGVEYEA